MYEKEFIQKSKQAEEDFKSEFNKTKARFGIKEDEYFRMSDSGIPVKPAYFPHDVEGLESQTCLAPGAYPFVRGLYPAQYQFMGWANQPVMGYGLPEDTRQRMDYLKSQGMTGYFGRTFYNIVWDLISHEGFDPDHPAAKGRIGRCGVAAYSKEDFARLFDGIDITSVNISLITLNETLAVLAHYLAYAEDRGISFEQLRGNTMNWYYSSAFCGQSCFKPKWAFPLAGELINFCSKNMPKWNTTNLISYSIEEAGGNAIQEVAFILAAGIEYSNYCIDVLKLHPDDYLPGISFQVAQANDFFEEIAKIKVLRKLWAEINHERFGAKDPKSMHVRIHTHTSGASLTRQQPLNNLIRTTIHTLGAMLSGVQAMEVCAWDEAIAIPTEESATLSLRIQQILQEETNIINVSDPLAGSYYLERLTAELENRVRKLLEEVENRGGYLKCWEDGYLRNETETSAYEWRKQVDNGEKIIVGVNKYNIEEEPEVPMFKIDENIEKIAIERIKKLRQTRNSEKFHEAIDYLDLVAKSYASGNYDGYELIPALVKASHNNATTGEMMFVLKKHFGWNVV